MDAKEQAYNALEKAANRIGANNYKAQIAEHIKRGRSKKTFRFSVTCAHKAVIDAMDDLINEKITPDQAFGLLLFDYGVDKERFV